MSGSFRWASPLGASVALFLVVGVLWVLIGALSYPLHRRGGEVQYLFVSERADAAYFGGPSGEFAAASPVLDKFRTLAISVIGGFLLMAGAMTVFVAWFGLRRGLAWALAGLALGVILAAVLWAVALAPYVRAGAPLTLADIPPFMSIPVILVVPASILGWYGVR